MKPDHAVKLFGLNNLIIESELRKLEAQLGVDMGRRPKSSTIDRLYFPQFSQSLRDESQSMARQYAVFYCLENSIRQLIDERMVEAYGKDWWSESKVVPTNVAKNCEDNLKRERESGVTPRSDNMIDYTTFGELGEIIRSNYDLFGGTFRDKGAVNRILNSLNTLRGPIAHCKALAEDEVLRLNLALRDWFRQMS